MAARHTRSTPARTLRLGEAAALLGVSVDTVRRWTDSGRLRARRTPGGHRVVDAQVLAALVMDAERSVGPALVSAHSARNRLLGVVTRVRKDGVMAQVDLRAGPFRIVSLLSREAADELGLRPGTIAVAVMKATSVSIELPAKP